MPDTWPNSWFDTWPDAWPALYMAGLGALHGLNPAMGWLFAVALGLQRRSRASVLAALMPIAVGHALSIAAGAGLLVSAGLLLPQAAIQTGCGLVLLGWAIYHWRHGHRHALRPGVHAGRLGLAAWSFAMATAHGSGVMLWPALMPACLAADAASTGLGGPAAAAAAGVAIHTLAMLTAMAVVAGLAYEGAGLARLQRIRIDADGIWPLALGMTAAVLLVY